MPAENRGPIQTLSQILRRLWSDEAAKPVRPTAAGVIVHDPAAEGPHDLDDPFFDRRVQARMADVIAGAHHNEKT